MKTNLYEKHVMSDTRIPFIFHKTHYPPMSGEAGFGNWHENIELLYIISGSARIFIDGVGIHACEGDTVVFNTNQVHKITSIDELEYYCLIIDCSFCLANYVDTSCISFKNVIHDDGISALINKFAREYETRSDSDFSVQMLRATALEITALLCRHHSIAGAPLREDTHMMSCIKQAIGYINSESHRDISLEEISNFVGLSKYYFTREFKRITRHTFVSYVNLVRCEKAKVMLSETRESIGVISRKCGFANQSYFTRVFRSYTGVLPAQYRTHA